VTHSGASNQYRIDYVSVGSAVGVAYADAPAKLLIVTGSFRSSTPSSGQRTLASTGIQDQLNRKPQVWAK
jgi:hypothetical protein